MKVAVTAQGRDLASPVDLRFGRADYFLLIDSETGEFAAYDNAQNRNTLQGAGIQAAQKLVHLGAQTVLTGNVGPKAFATLQAGQVTIYRIAAGTVQQAMEQWLAGSLESAAEANVEEHGK